MNVKCVSALALIGTSTSTPIIIVGIHVSKG